MPITKNLTVVKDFSGTSSWPAGAFSAVDLTCVQGGAERTNLLSVVLVNLVGGSVQEVTAAATGVQAVTKITSACTGQSAYVKESYYDVYGAQNPCCGAAAPGNTTPIPPTVSGDDTANTLTASHSLGNSEILVSTNGSAFVAYTGAISVGNVARAVGYWQFKVKSAPGRNESALANSPEFTIAASQLGTPAPAASSLTTTGFTIGWPAVTNAEQYEVQVHSNAGFTAQVAGGTVNAPTAAFNFTTGAAFTQYWFRVRALASGYTTSNWGSGDATTLEAWDTILEFSTSNQDSGASVGGTVTASNAVQEFAFNADSSITGTPASMNIEVGGTLEILIDFPSDYVGQAFRYKDLSGTYRRSTFVNGTRSF